MFMILQAIHNHLGSLRPGDKRRAMKKMKIQKKKMMK